MLEVEWPRQLCGFEEVNTKITTMPVDFASYLLSSSPPGFDMYHHCSGAPGFGGLANRLGIHQPRSIIVNGSNSSSAFRVSSAPQLQSLGEDDCESINTSNSTSCSTGDFVGTIAKEPKNGVKLIVSDCEPKLKKRVSFADDLGLALEVVKIIKESSDTPPRLRTEVLSTITVGAVAGVTEKPPLVLQFSQPASDYLAFREKVERNLVSLENVILKDYNLIGTIRVKNVAFEKTVRVRCTFDSWETHTDIHAQYVPSISVPGRSSRYDTFKFEMNVPPTLDLKKKVQFCICYETNNTQYWDSNNGANYEVTSADWRDKEDKSVFTINYERDWTSYSSWSSVDSSVPYY